VALSLLLFGAGLVATALASRPEPVSVAAGAAYFHHRDLGAPYATGVPFALALAALDRYPEELGRNRDEFCAKFGVLVDPDRGRRLPVGFVLRRDRWTGTDFLMTNCALCHTGVIGGRKIDGLGNRNLRLNAMNHAILRIAGRADFTAGTMLPAAEAAARRRQLPWDWRSRWVAGIAIRELKEMTQRERTPGQRGMSRVDAGPGRNTPIEFAKTISGVAIQPPYGYTKIPAVWMYAKRRTFGWDGALAGDKGLMLASVEFNKGMPPKEILRHPERWQSLNAYLSALRPPIRAPSTRSSPPVVTPSSWPTAPAVTARIVPASPTDTRSASCPSPSSGPIPTASAPSRPRLSPRGGRTPSASASC